ncbi:MAG: 6-pyruvoyl tetrahydropterin synthase family protein [Candidatus Hermodarchaeota archaeon]
MGFKVIVGSSDIKFSASHFLKAPLQCTRLHGHNYYVSVELSDNLDTNNFVVDFTDLKAKIISIVKPIDHHVLIPRSSDELKIREEKDSIEVITSSKRYVFPREDVFFLPLSATTSELLAKYIHNQLKEIYKNKKIKVTIEESRSTKAVFED